MLPVSYVNMLVDMWLDIDHVVGLVNRFKHSPHPNSEQQELLRSSNIVFNKDSIYTPITTKVKKKSYIQTHTGKLRKGNQNLVQEITPTEYTLLSLHGELPQLRSLARPSHVLDSDFQNTLTSKSKDIPTAPHQQVNEWFK